jgi:hypothetical protein
MPMHTLTPTPHAYAHTIQLIATALYIATALFPLYTHAHPTCRMCARTTQYPRHGYVREEVLTHRRYLAPPEPMPSPPSVSLSLF